METPNAEESKRIQYPVLPQIDDATIREYSTTSSLRTPRKLVREAATITFQTPRRPRANSGKKRRYPDLSRPASSPNHRTRVASIFTDAADQLRHMSLSRAKPWLRKASDVASPLSHRATKAACLPLRSYQDDEQQQLVPRHITSTESSSNSSVRLPALAGRGEDGSEASGRRAGKVPPDASGKEPISSGFTSPAGLVERRDCESRLRGGATDPQPAFDDGDLDLDCEVHSTHGVPLVLPIRGAPGPSSRVHANVKAWLDSVRAPETHSSGGPLGCGLTQVVCSVAPLKHTASGGEESRHVRHQRPATRGKGKENIPPSESALHLHCSDTSTLSKPGSDPPGKHTPSHTSDTRHPPRVPLRELPLPSSSPFSCSPRAAGTPPPRARPLPPSPGGRLASAPRRKRKHPDSPSPAPSSGIRKPARRVVMLANARVQSSPRISRWRVRQTALSTTFDGSGIEGKRGKGSAGEESSGHGSRSGAGEELPLLSGSVERFRKGKRPTPDRRPSYWDRDMWLGPGRE